MIDLKLACETLTTAGINAHYENENQFRVNSVTILIKNDVITFGEVRVRIRDVYNFLSFLNSEDLISISQSQKIKLERIYLGLYYENLHTIKSKT